MDEMPRMVAEQFIGEMRARVEETLRGVANAVNDAPTGQIINASEERVRDLFGRLREQAYELALQMRVDAAEAAFSPSGRPDDRTAQTQ